MKNVLLLLLLLLPIVSGCHSASEDQPPNIVLIVADDLGYSDLGSFGSEIRTPNLDSLASHGLKLTNFHAAPTCGPTRAMLMTGIDPHPVGMSANAAAIRRIKALQGRPGYEGHLNDSAITVATLLADAGYQTYISGKWDLGSVAGSRPIDRGFQQSFVLSSGGASHFSDASGSVAIETKAKYLEGAEAVETLPKEFYSSRFYTDRAIEYIEQGDSHKPFFAYVAYTAPHWPLQVPDDWIEKYRGQYDSGWTDLAQQRLKRQQEAGLINHVPDIVPPRGVADWWSLPEGERVIRAREMEVYAAMIEYMDWQIGRLLETVDAKSRDRETLVIFLSDNGPEGNAIDRIGATGKWVAETFNNDLHNMGRQNSFLWQGPGWAHASAQPLRLYKSFVAEGGIRTPAIMSFTGTKEDLGNSAALVVATDVPATILDAAGVKHPGSSYRGQAILPIEGRSAMPLLTDEHSSIHNNEPIGWELYGNRALIKDNWKAILLWPTAGNGEWQLFDIDSDPFESNDLSSTNPDKLAELVNDWRRYADERKLYIFEEDNGYGRY